MERCGPSANRCVYVRRDQPVAAVWRSRAWCQAGKQDQLNRCRYPTRAKPWQRAPLARPASSGLRHPDVAWRRDFHDVTQPRLRRVVRSNDVSRAPPSGAYSQKPKWCGGSELILRGGDKLLPKLHSTSRLPAAISGFQSPGPIRGDGRCR